MNLFAYYNKLLAVVEIISKQLFMSYNVLLCLYITVRYENHELIIILSLEKSLMILKYIQLRSSYRAQ